MNTEVICALIAGAATVLAAIAERRSRLSANGGGPCQRREKESRLAMDLMYANCSCSLTTAKKLAGMHTNGDVEEAMEAARSAQEAYQDFARDEAAHQFSKV